MWYYCAPWGQERGQGLASCEVLCDRERKGVGGEEGLVGRKERGRREGTRVSKRNRMVKHRSGRHLFSELCMAKYFFVVAILLYFCFKTVYIFILHRTNITLVVIDNSTNNTTIHEENSLQV